MLGPTYQLMLLTTSQSNFTKVVDKAAKVELAIKVGLVQDAPLALTSFSKIVPKRSQSPNQKQILCKLSRFPSPVKIAIMF